MDVFGGLAGDHQPDEGPRVAPELLEPVLDGAALWGLELETRFRVLAATFEVAVAHYPWGETDDRRIQVLCFPVSTILASLRTVDDGRRTVQTFDIDQLVDVVSVFGGAPVSAPLFGHAEPRPDQWGPAFSAAGRSTVGDGVSETITVSVAAPEAELDVFARFDEVQVKDPSGRDLVLPP